MATEIPQRNAWVTKKYIFEAAHHLPAHNGKCVRNHGHTYGLEVEISGPIKEGAGPKQGMVMEFADLNAIVREQIIAVLDHQDLNEVIPEEYQPATTENVAWWIFSVLYASPSLQPMLWAVRVSEGPMAVVEIGRVDYEDWLEKLSDAESALEDEKEAVPDPIILPAPALVLE